MSCAEQIKEYIKYTIYPFTSSQIVDELGICYETVKKYLQELIAEGYIKKIGNDKGKNVFVLVKYKDVNTKYLAKNKHYTLESIQEAYRRQVKERRERFDDLL